MAEKNKKYVELIWADKYDKLEKGDTPPLEKPNLPFQVVETVNRPRIKDIEDKLFDPASFFPEDKYPKNYPNDWKNLLIWGDNKLVMSSFIKQGWAGKINLIYIDPPFFTGSDFTVRTKIGGEEVEKEPSIIEERSYKDTWSGGIASYLKYMHERLLLMRELLAENGSIYVHLDWHVGHYVKVMMDEIFGYENFRNEIVWQKIRVVKAQSRGFGSVHDVLFCYSRNENFVFNQQYRTFDENYETKFDKVDPETGKRYQLVSLIQKGSGPSRRFGKKVLTPPPGMHWIWSQERIDEALKNGEIEFTLGGKGTPRKRQYYDPEKGQQVHDIWTDIYPVNSQANESCDLDTQKPETLLTRIILVSSNPSDIIADFFCGSGTTLAVAEKLGRRWIGSDLSKFAIQVTRKRLLDIPNSKDMNIDKEKKDDIQYSRPARPFELWNIGNYETVYWQEKQDEYLVFMLKLYQAQPLKQFRYLHGQKGKRAVHIGPLSAPVTMEEIEKVVVECRANDFDKADILGWEWSYDINELAKELSKKNGVDIKLIQIPSVNEIKASLVGFDLQLLKVPDEAIEKALLPYIKFVEMAYLEIETKIKKDEVQLKITDFQVPPTAELTEIAEKIKDSRELIDYWAIDWDYKGDTFHNQWQSFRVKKSPKVDYIARHQYTTKGEYRIMVKVVDVFGNDTNKIIIMKI